MITSSFNDTRFFNISENIKIIKNEIAEAAIKSNRAVDDVRLMAVTKTVCVEYINYAIDNCGIDLIGERFPRESDFIRPLGIQKNINDKGDMHIDIISLRH